MLVVSLLSHHVLCFLSGACRRVTAGPHAAFVPIKAAAVCFGHNIGIADSNLDEGINMCVFIFGKVAAPV
jgi:hypothetical protein